jgi:hypothetical protein
MKIAHSEQTSVGEIRYVYTLGPQETKALRLLLSESGDLKSLFYSLWGDVLYYENGSFGIKELMPTIVNKLQKQSQFSDLESILKNDYLMLQSLPKYTWTKNWYARNQFLQIAKQLKHTEIDFVLLKGIAETFLNADALNARTCRDIDILINPSQIKHFTRVVGGLGWECKDIAPNTLAGLSSFAGKALNFRHPTGIVELDVHFAGAALNWTSHEEFVQKIWLEARRTQPDFLMPGDECRLLISAWNVFDVENIKSEQILKYFYDFMSGTKGMSVAKKLAFVKVANQNLNFAKQTMWLLALDAKVKKNWLQYILFRLLFSFALPRNLTFKIRITEQIYYWLYHTRNIVTSRFNKRLSWYQMLFRTVVESDTYKARRDSYASIIKTKRDNLKSSLLSSYWQTKDFLKNNTAFTPLSVPKMLKHCLSMGVAPFIICGHSIKACLKNFNFSSNKNAGDTALLPETKDPNAAEKCVKTIYFVSINYFESLPVNKITDQRR